MPTPSTYTLRANFIEHLRARLYRASAPDWQAVAAILSLLARERP
jgi:hypothetical protein